MKLASRLGAVTGISPATVSAGLNPFYSDTPLSRQPLPAGFLFMELTNMNTKTETNLSPHVFTPLADNSPASITISLVADEQRLRFWPQHFGAIPQWVLLEPRIFAWLDRLCTDYSGGIWQFYTLSNGGAFMAPEDDDGEKWTLFNSMNGNGAELSAQAAGIAACLMTYSHHACRTECDAMTEHYYRLRDYALAHAESRAIMSIID
jgi:hypothetical protein